MPRYFFEVRYASPSVDGLAPKDAAARLVENAGGKLANWLFSLGGHEVYLVADLPDEASARTVHRNAQQAGEAIARYIPISGPETA